MSPTTGPPGPSRFQTTRWSVILAAGGSMADSRAALEELCATYWRPVYGFIRRRGHGAEEARDLTQGFFATFLERRDVQGLDRSRGRFRSYLLVAVRNFLTTERERARALKRGGDVAVFSLSAPAGAAPTIDPADARTPEVDYERQWALAVLRRAMQRLRDEQDDRGRLELFERLKPTLAGERVDGGYTRIADEMNLTTVAVKVAAHRLKKRYAELLLGEVARTVDLPHEIEDEMRHLYRALEG